jgi:hypothetical protein
MIVLKVIATRERKDGWIADRVRVVNSATGEEIAGIRTLDYHADPDNVPSLKLEILAPEVEIEVARTPGLTADASPDHPGLQS